MEDVFSTPTGRPSAAQHEDSFKTPLESASSGSPALPAPATTAATAAVSSGGDDAVETSATTPEAADRPGPPGQLQRRLSMPAEASLPCTCAGKQQQQQQQRWRQTACAVEGAPDGGGTTEPQQSPVPSWRQAARRDLCLVGASPTQPLKWLQERSTQARPDNSDTQNSALATVADAWFRDNVTPSRIGTKIPKAPRSSGEAKQPEIGDPRGREERQTQPQSRGQAQEEEEEASETQQRQGPDERPAEVGNSNNAEKSEKMDSGDDEDDDDDDGDDGDEEEEKVEEEVQEDPGEGGAGTELEEHDRMGGGGVLSCYSPVCDISVPSRIRDCMQCMHERAAELEVRPFLLRPTVSFYGAGRRSWAPVSGQGGACSRAPNRAACIAGRSAGGAPGSSAPGSGATAVAAGCCCMPTDEQEKRPLLSNTPRCSGCCW
jgi:hypothetical protein